jgi:hypothetical protein
MESSEGQVASATALILRRARPGGQGDRPPTRRRRRAGAQGDGYREALREIGRVPLTGGRVVMSTGEYGRARDVTARRDARPASVDDDAGAPALRAA